MINLEPLTSVLVGQYICMVLENPFFKSCCTNHLTPGLAHHPLNLVSHINFLFVILIIFRGNTAPTKVGWCIKSQGDDFYWQNDQWYRSCRNRLG